MHYHSTKKNSINCQPMQELAFYRTQYEINGKSFYCSEACYEGELMNGVELNVKEVKGLQNNIDKVDYLSESQQIVFSCGSNIVTYNTHKRTFQKLLEIKQTLEMLRSHVERKNGKEFILWVEKKEISQTKAAQSQMLNLKAQTGLVHMLLPIKKEAESSNARKVTFGDIFGSFIDETQRQVHGVREIKDQIQNQKNLDSSFRLIPNSLKQLKSKKTINLQLPKNYQYTFQIYDFTKKQMIYKHNIQMKAHWKLKDIFLFHNAYKYAGYIYFDQNAKKTFISYQNLEEYNYKDEELRQGTMINFFQIEPYWTIPCKNFENQIKYNSQLGSFIFSQGKSVYSINLCYERDQIKLSSNLIQGEAEITLDPMLPKKTTILNPIKLAENQKQSELAIILGVFSVVQTDDAIISLTLSQQYLACLTSKSILVYSAFEMDQLVFALSLIEDNIIIDPSFIEFNKTAILLAHKNSSKISTFGIKANQLKFQGTTELQINHCKEILKIFTNSISTEIICVSRLYQLQGRMSSVVKSRKVVENTFEYVIKPACIDINISYVGSSSKSQAKTLGINCQLFKRVLTCPWLSSYLIQTQDQIQSSNWKESFQNKKCSIIHPTGLYLIVCFKQCFKIYLLTIQGLGNTYQGDNIKDIQSAAFNEYGNTFAIAGTNTISIYNFYDRKKISTINLSVGAVIEKIQFRNGQLVCFLKNKKMYVYNTLDYKELFSFNPKPYLTEVQNSQENTIFPSKAECASSLQHISDMWYDNELAVIILSYRTSLLFVNLISNLQICSFQFGYSVTCFYFNVNLGTLFLGTQSGQILSFSWPNKPTKLLSEHLSYKYHRKKIIDLKVTSDLKQLISVSQDESVYISSLTYVENLKKMQGLEIVQHKDSQIQICFDFLFRKGFCLYSHSQLSQKIDLVKDYQDEIMNINFIMPEQRIKQKEGMLQNVEITHNALSVQNQQHFAALSHLSSEIRRQINYKREQIRTFAIESDKLKQDLTEQMYHQYLELYNANMELEVKKKKQKESHEVQKCRIRQECAKNKAQKILQYESHLKSTNKDYNITSIEPYSEIQEGDLMDEQKKVYIKDTIHTLSQMIVDLSLSNGVLLCKSNNTLKQIDSLKHKIEENKSLIYSIENSVRGLLEEQQKYQTTKQYQNKMMAQEDQVNLSAIERKYVKQTKIIIEKDVEINNKIVRYEKEKNMLVHLEKNVEEIQEQIQKLVSNILQERIDLQPELTKLEDGNKKIAKLIVQRQEKIRQNKQSANHMKIKIMNLLKIVHQITEKGEISKEKLMQRLIQDELVEQKEKQNDKLLKKEAKANIDQRCSNLFRNTSGFDFSEKKNGKLAATVRKLQTQPRQSNYKVSVSNKDQYHTKFKHFKENIKKKTSKIIFHQNSQEKYYERIKTEQIVYENSRKKFTTQNQDLIKTFNTLAYDNKMLRFLMTKRQNDYRDPSKRTYRQVKKKSDKPTPFVLYIKNKATRMKTLPCATYDY